MLHVLTYPNETQSPCFCELEYDHTFAAISSSPLENILRAAQAKYQEALEQHLFDLFGSYDRAQEMAGDYVVEEAVPAIVPDDSEDQDNVTWQYSFKVRLKTEEEKNETRAHDSDVPMVFA
jgi:hypothetical protein